ncbi:unnamed protein product [Zymoseptoria tritici ST99CH_1A5]|uniref:Small ribosomal subunit protein uS11m n=2 Tax=Zymoseptoria tritici TaxID=1047171 RepID=A0A2H1FNZ4_ZYMTR|nr:unnamed protein product [Zymoseptoria tritici ST99CH_1E4]SMY20394.1 unnamed protein product [Zymoseptoria tritici ST99CH_1A5]
MASTRLFSSSLCHTCRQRLLPAHTTLRAAAFSTTTPLLRDDDALAGLAAIGQRSRGAATTNNTRTAPRSAAPRSFPPSGRTGEGPSISDILDETPGSLFSSDYMDNLSSSGAEELPHRLHIYATKHNTHMTLVQPQRPATQTPSSGISAASASAADMNKKIDVLLSLSAGNIGFRKAGRGSYDAAYQLAAFVLKQIQEKGMLVGHTKLEVVLRGFGAGREACTKALLGAEGSMIRGRIVRVVDATRLKQGGPRSKKPRRLG